jgi:hypothetical protein
VATLGKPPARSRFVCAGRFAMAASLRLQQHQQWLWHLGIRGGGWAHGMNRDREEASLDASRLSSSRRACLSRRRQQRRFQARRTSPVNHVPRRIDSWEFPSRSWEVEGKHKSSQPPSIYLHLTTPCTSEHSGVTEPNCEDAKDSGSVGSQRERV